MDKPLTLDIQVSKLYLFLTLFAYLLALFSSWYYFYSLWLSLTMSGGLSFWLLHFLPKYVCLTHPSSIVKISLTEDKIILGKNNQSTQQYSIFQPQYQSRFLVIICAGKASIVVFKDSLKSASLSQLNRYLNANT